MASHVARIARAFLRQNGARFNPQLVSLVRPGVIVDIDKAHDVDYRTDLATLGVDVPAVQVADATIPAFQAIRNVAFKAKAEAALAQWVDVSAGLDLALTRSTSFAYSMDDQRFEVVDWMALERAIVDALDAGNIQLEAALEAAGWYIVTGVYRGTIAASFDKQGAASFDLRAELTQLGGFDLGPKWTWKSAATLASTDVRPFAFETARFHFGTRRLVEAHT